MDERKFDALAKGLAEGTSRRQALRLLGGGLAAGLISLFGVTGATAKCRQADRPCREDKDCCSRSCVDRRCAEGSSTAPDEAAGQQPATTVEPSPEPVPSRRGAAASETRSLAANEFSIPSGRPGWHQTSVQLRQGQRFTVAYVRGTWSVDRRSLPYVGPEGYSAKVDRRIYQGCKFVPGVRYGRLLGKVGDGPIVSVGKGGTFQANASGPLSLRIHDADHCLADNAGRVIVRVRALDSSPGCTRDGDCTDGDPCTIGSCEGGVCRHRLATCRVRLLVVLPSDWFGSPTHEQLGSPSLAQVRTAAANARDRINAFYASASGLHLRFSDVYVLTAPHDTRWFTTRTVGAAAASDNLIIDYISGRGGRGEVSATATCDHPNREAINVDRLSRFLADQGFGGLYPDGWINLVIFGSTWRGGFAGAFVPEPAKPVPGAAPHAGPRLASTAIVGQWVLDVVLTGDDSPSCLGCQGDDCNDVWPCPANVGWGTLMHELGHSLGLGHSCEGWEAEHWGFTPARCDQLVMQSHWNYPNVGFHQKEVGILALNPALANGATSSAVSTEGVPEVARRD